MQKWERIVAVAVLGNRGATSSGTEIRWILGNEMKFYQPKSPNSQFELRFGEMER